MAAGPYRNQINMIEQRISHLVQLGCRLIMSAKSLDEYSDMPLQEKVLNVIHELESGTTTNDYLSPNQEHFSQLTEQERIDLFTRNRERLRMPSDDDEIPTIPDLETDIYKEKALPDLGLVCFGIALCYSLLYEQVKAEKNGIDDQTNQTIYTLLSIDTEVSQRAYESLGYWLHASPRRNSSHRGPGACSKEIGDISVKKAKDILKEIGGIAAYDTLPHGHKTPIIDKIANALYNPKNPKAPEVPSERNVFHILNRIRKESKQN